jgi:hypothetical protein
VSAGVSPRKIRNGVIREENYEIIHKWKENIFLDG